MTQDDAARIFAEELEKIAPEADLAAAGPAEDLRELFELDSMDFLNLVSALHKRLGIDIPEADYPRLATLEDAAAYLESRAGKP